MDICYGCMYRFPSFPHDDEIFRSMEDLLIREQDDNAQPNETIGSSAKAGGEVRSVARLEVCEFGGRRKSYAVCEGSSLSIGRSIDNEIVLRDARVSRMHTRIDCDVKGIWIEDLGSLNGTYLNACPVKERAMIAFGDEFTICGVKFTVHRLQ
ncbi:MAG: FHA domain-containing protein [Actinobacteria bacterium]|nr:FHA domain-containing protein [Actinomycetota bacterium]